MTLQQIHYALVVAETGSMNRAAEKLYVTQPALTAAIQELETEIHAPIFNRTNRGVSLATPRTYYLPMAMRLLPNRKMERSKHSMVGSIRQR